MIVYCRATNKKKKRKVKPVAIPSTAPTSLFGKPVRSDIKIAKLQKYRAPDHSHIPSLETNSQFVGARNSMMEPSVLMKESPETQKEIVAKSKRISIPFNKAAYQYIDTPEQALNIGRK
jgi:hypothetical protein